MHPAPPLATSPAAGRACPLPAVPAAGRARCGCLPARARARDCPGLCGHRAIPVPSPGEQPVPLRGRCLLEERYLGWYFCLTPFLLPARGFARSSHGRILPWWSR